MVLVISGETPSKKNSRINTRSGRSFPSKRFMEWQDYAVGQVIEQTSEEFSRGGWQGYDLGMELTVTFYHGDMRKRDGDNQLNSIHDMLVKAGVLAGDHWTVLPVEHIWHTYDKGNPRCVISLEPVK